MEFTDARGGKVRYDHKVGTDKWPKVSFVKKSRMIVEDTSLFVY